MSKRADIELLCDIQDAIKKIMSYTEMITLSNFLKNSLIQDAVVRNFEIIGEATKNISQGLKKKYKDIPWHDMARFRDKLIHHYSGIDFQDVWDIIIDVCSSNIKDFKKTNVEILAATINISLEKASKESLPELAPQINGTIRKEDSLPR